MSLPPICILAGGLGTRLGDKVAETPKPLLEVAGEPFLFHQLRLLASYGAARVVLCVGYLGHLIEEHVGSVRFGVEIDYCYDAPGLDGTLGAIRRALPLLGDRFLILYGDTYLRLNYVEAARTWERSGCAGLMTVLRNEGRWDTSNAVYADGLVLSYDKTRPTADMYWIDYGLGGLLAAAVPATGRDLAGLYHDLARRNELCGFEVSERFYEIGTPAALTETEAFLTASRSRSEAGL
jgi:N-acetyl-alpha-D-muramate 1-phosphate uridylyltransferase